MVSLVAADDFDVAIFTQSGCDVDLCLDGAFLAIALFDCHLVSLLGGVDVVLGGVECGGVVSGCSDGVYPTSAPSGAGGGYDAVSAV